MNTRTFSLTAMTLILMVACLASIPWSSSRKGPREDDMVIYFYGSQEAAYTALSVGAIDFIGGAGYSPSLFPCGNIDAVGFLTSVQADQAFSNPNLVAGKVRAFNMYQFDLNNNETVATYPGIKSPMSYVEMRQAVAYCSDKATYVVIMGAKAERIDQPLPARLSGWGDPALMKPNYPYEFSTLAASLLLDTMFPQNTSAGYENPNFNAGIPGSIPYLRNYPDGHPQKAHNVLDPLIVCVRNEHSHRLQAGRLCYANMQAIGLPLAVNENPMSVLKPIVMDQMDYHFYTGAWTTWKYPTHVYPLYHSAFTYPGGPNYVTGNGTHPKLDECLEQFYYSLSFNRSVAACQIAMREFTLECVTVPLWSDYSYCAWSTSMLGMVNMDGYGIMNPFTFMNAYKIDGSPIRCGAIKPPNAMNMVYSSWAYDYANLDRMNLYSCFDSPPYNPNLAVDQPGFVMDWETLSWGDTAETQTEVFEEALNATTPGFIDLSNAVYSINYVTDDGAPLTPDTEYNITDYRLYIIQDVDDGHIIEVEYVPAKTYLTMTVRDDGYFAKPVSGDPGENVNASQCFWNAWLDYQVGDGWFWPSFKDLDHIEITGTYDFEIYFDTFSYWNTYAATGPLRPMDTWMAQGEDFLNSTVETFVNPTTPGVIDLDNAPIWFNYVKFNDVPLEFITDYNIVLGDLYIYSALGAGTLEVSYWYIPTTTALRGYVPGAPAVGWQTIFEGAGPYYCTGFTAGLGGSATYKRSPWYYMVTPLLGEIDWVKQPNGNYKVDIADLAWAGGAFGSQGTGIPSVNWFPGADLAPDGGVIDIFDLTTVAGAPWDKEYDPTEP